VEQQSRNFIAKMEGMTNGAGTQRNFLISMGLRLASFRLDSLFQEHKLCPLSTPKTDNRLGSFPPLSPTAKGKAALRSLFPLTNPNPPYLYCCACTVADGRVCGDRTTLNRNVPFVLLTAQQSLLRNSLFLGKIGNRSGSISKYRSS
jgi:hypothetical protein